MAFDYLLVKGGNVLFVFVNQFIDFLELGDRFLGIPGTLLGERLTLAFFVAGTASLFKAYPWRHQYTYKFCSIRGCIFH